MKIISSLLDLYAMFQSFTGMGIEANAVEYNFRITSVRGQFIIAQGKVQTDARIVNALMARVNKMDLFTKNIRIEFQAVPPKNIEEHAP